MAGASWEIASDLLKNSWSSWQNSGFSVDYALKIFSWDPLISTFWVCLGIAFMCWFLSILTNNYSWVDKIWSITPWTYAWIFLLGSGVSIEKAHPRLLAMTILPTLWGLRLSYNFFRKGGYAWHGEDYRWKEIQSRVHWILYQIFNITFIAPYQNVLLWLIVTPMWIAYRNQDTAWNSLDWIATIGFSTLLIFETIADQQQWNFHHVKSALKNNEAVPDSLKEYINDAKRGFLASKLFRYSRHPNFFCEMSMWWMYYLYSVAATQGAQWINWTIVGTILLTLLFQGSTNFTEILTLKKYPVYAKYQSTTSRLFPGVPGTPLDKLQ